MLKRNIVANYAGTAWNAAMSLAFVPLYVKYLGTESYGLVGVSALLNAYMAFFTMGLAPMVAREVARFQGGLHSAESIRSLLRVVEILIFGISGACITALWLGAPWLASTWLKTESLSDTSVAHALRIMSAVIGLRFLEGLYNSALMGLQRQITANFLSSLAATLRGAGSLAVLTWWSPTIDTFFWWQGFVACLGAVASALSTYAHLPRVRVSIRRGRAALRDAWPFARGMLLASALSLLATQTDKLLLTRLLDLADYGRYTLAVSVASSLVLFTVPIHGAFYPRITALLSADKPRQAAHEFHRAAQLVSASAGSVGIVLFLFADRILLLWTGDTEIMMEVGGPLRLLLLGYLCYALRAMPFTLQLAAGHTALSNWLSTAAVVLTVPSILLAVPSGGISAACAIWFFLNIGLLVAFAPMLFRRLPSVRLRYWLASDLAKPLGAALLTALIAWLGSHMLRVTPAVSLAVVLLTLGASAVAALLSSPLLRKPVITIAARLLRCDRCLPGWLRSDC